MGSQDSYSDDAILVAIREWFNLDKSYAVCIDLQRVYPYLAREYRDVFQLVALGFTPTEVARYWAGMVGGGSMGRDRGRRVLKRLVKEIQRYLKLYLVELDPAKGPQHLTRRPSSR